MLCAAWRDLWTTSIYWPALHCSTITLDCETESSMLKPDSKLRTLEVNCPCLDLVIVEGSAL